MTAKFIDSVYRMDFVLSLRCLTDWLLEQMADVTGETDQAKNPCLAGTPWLDLFLQ